MAGQTKKLTPSVPRAETIYASFSREEERAFLFSGGANPMAELLYVEQGSLHSVADGRKQVLQPGDFVIYSPNQWHMQYADTDVAPRCLRVFFEISGSLKGLQDRKFTATGLMEPLFAQLLLDIEPAGAKQVRASMPEATLIFIMPPSMEELERRLRGRGDTPEDQIQIRMERANWEIEQNAWYDHVVVNDDAQRCAEEILKIIAE